MRRLNLDRDPAAILPPAPDDDQPASPLVTLGRLVPAALLLPWLPSAVSLSIRERPNEVARAR